MKLAGSPLILPAPEPGERKRGPPGRGKRSPQARLKAVEIPEAAVADWASLFGDLSRGMPEQAKAGSPVDWRVHDRTHLEFAIDYPISPQPVAHTWEAYFFVPESFRLHSDTYDKRAIYDDLWSYVRRAVPRARFVDLPRRGEGAPLDQLGEALAAASGREPSSREARRAMRRLRLFACQVRASGLSAMREVEFEARQREPDLARLGRLATSYLATSAAVAGAFRAALGEAESLSLPDDVACASRWTDEDISLVLETFCASLGVLLEKRSRSLPEIKDLAEKVATGAVNEARHRARQGYTSVGRAVSSARSVEHLEFRRHVLKRFTSSVLWLSLEVRSGTSLAVHVLYALAAAAAMSIALFASLQTNALSEHFFRYAILVVISYAVKDRSKALLQEVFAGWIAKRFPDRRWLIRDRDERRRVGEVRERAGFLPFRQLPAGVLEKRRQTREHSLEEQARPERVLWHQKTVLVDPLRAANDAGDAGMMTEIFRLNLARWLSHADDPNRKIVFADPDDARVYSATARRVYNVNVVYRLQSGDRGAPWRRLRVVVSRKGIERIDELG